MRKFMLKPSLVKSPSLLLVIIISRVAIKKKLEQAQEDGKSGWGCSFFCAIAPQGIKKSSKKTAYFIAIWETWLLYH